MNELTITLQQYKELKRLLDEMGNSPLSCKGELECYDDETKAKWDAGGVTFWLSSEEE